MTDKTQELAEIEVKIEEFKKEHLKGDKVNVLVNEQERPCHALLLPKQQAKVFLVDEWTQGEIEENAIALQKSNVEDDNESLKLYREYVHFRMLASVAKVEDKDGKEIQFTIEWYLKLFRSDAKILIDYIDIVLEGKE